MLRHVISSGISLTFMTRSLQVQVKLQTTVTCSIPRENHHQTSSQSHQSACVQLAIPAILCYFAARHEFYTVTTRPCDSSSRYGLMVALSGYSPVAGLTQISTCTHQFQHCCISMIVYIECGFKLTFILITEMPSYCQVKYSVST